MKEISMNEDEETNGVKINDEPDKARDSWYNRLPPGIKKTINVIGCIIICAVIAAVFSRPTSEDSEGGYTGLAFLIIFVGFLYMVFR
jgi:hypothetical protein